jgi:hypothetical protein
MWQRSSTAGTKGTRTHSHEDCVCPDKDNYQDGHSAARHHARGSRIPRASRARTAAPAAVC